MDAIIYQSFSGFTEKYAKMLSEQTGIPAYDIMDKNNLPKRDSKIVYMGPLHAGIISGYSKALKMYEVKALCAVGMIPPGESPQMEGLRKKYGNIFYLQGGFSLDRLKGINKFLMFCMSKMVSKSLAKKQDKTPEEAQMLDWYLNGGDCVKEENLAEVRDFIEKQKLV